LIFHSNQERSNEEWKIKRGAMKNGKSRMENQDRSNEEWKIKNIAPILIFHSSLLLS
jgi:hypothetical protein